MRRRVAGHRPGRVRLDVYRWHSWYWVTLCAECDKPYPCEAVRVERHGEAATAD